MTPGLIIIKEYNRPIAHILQHGDGYPSGLGMNLANFLDCVELVNGLGMPFDDDRIVCNGAGCMAAQLICHLKQGPGGIYLESDAGDFDGWKYIVEANELDPLYICVRNNNLTVLKGSIAAFKAFCRVAEC